MVVKTKSGSFTRPIQRIHDLELNRHPIPDVSLDEQSRHGIPDGTAGEGEAKSRYEYPDKPVNPDKAEEGQIKSRYGRVSKAPERYTPK